MQLTPPSQGFASMSVFLAAAVWGIYWVPLHYIEAQGASGTWPVVLLNAPAVLAMALVALFQWKRHVGQWGRILLIGAFTGAGVALYASGLVLTTVVKATLLFYLTPIWATAIGVIWLNEQMNWKRVAAIVLGLVGLVLLVSDGSGISFETGDLFALASGMFWAVGASLILHYEDTPLAGMTMGMFLAAVLVAAGLGVIAGAGGPPDMAEMLPVMPAITAIAVLVLIPVVVIVFWAQKFLFPGRVGLLMMSEVITAVLTASLLLPEETMSPIQWAGAALVVGACLLEVLGSSEDTRTIDA